MKSYRLCVLILTLTITNCLSEAPPKAKWKGIKEVILDVGETRDLHCDITGDPVPTYTWSKYTYWWKKIKEFPTKEETLRLTNVKSEDAGIYLCEAENRLGKAGHRFVVRVPKAPVVTKFTEDWEPGKLFCQAEGYPAPKIIWERKKGYQWTPLEKGEKYSTWHLRRKTRIIGYLTILSVNPADTGMYRCRGVNLLGEASKELSVEIKPRPPLVKPVEPFTREVTEGSSITLTCYVYAYPKAKITWHFKGVQVAQGEDLSIPNASMKDQGTYICRGTNIAGSTDGKGISVTVTPKDNAQ